MDSEVNNDWLIDWLINSGRFQCRSKYDKDCNVSDFLDTMYSNLLPHIAFPTHVTLNSQTLIDSIFSDNYDSFFTSGNLVTTLSDQHAQFLLMEFQTKQMDNEKSKCSE